MRNSLGFFKSVIVVFIFLLLASCSSMGGMSHSSYYPGYRGYDSNVDYGARMPQSVDTQGKKLVLVDPNVHVWGAYAEDGHLVKAGIATAGGTVCPPDEQGEPTCRTAVGTFHVTNIGGSECYSKTYPRPHGGGLMPYCMFFNNGQALHGSPDPVVVEANVSHGCVRMRISDAEWMVNNFVRVGTKVRVLPYNGAS